MENVGMIMQIFVFTYVILFLLWHVLQTMVIQLNFIFYSDYT